MSAPKVYVICDSNCKYEGMTKEQILTAIANAVATGEIGDCDTGFITKIKTINGYALRFFVGTQDEYEALSAADKQNLFAIITNDTTKEGIESAITELKTSVGELQNQMNTHTHNADEITEGILPVERGGTGTTTLASVRANLALWFANPETPRNMKIYGGAGYFYFSMKLTSVSGTRTLSNIVYWDETDMIVVMGHFNEADYFLNIKSDGSLSISGINAGVTMSDFKVATLARKL